MGSEDEHRRGMLECIPWPNHTTPRVNVCTSQKPVHSNLKVDYFALNCDEYGVQSSVHVGTAADRCIDETEVGQIKWVTKWRGAEVEGWGDVEEDG